MTVTLTFPSSGSGGGAPTTAQYLALAADGGLSAERVLTAGTGITFTDNGAGGTLVVATSAAVPSLARMFLLMGGS